jgi:hypothetical protein
MVDRQGGGIGQGHNKGSDFSSSSTVQKTPRENRKQYICTYENCNKSFTRSDHLQRHRLNHGTGKACPRCSVHFNRPDLLDRHLARHRQKDEEAGGYGLGVIETRKRMWRDADGNIVSKRPTLPNNNPAATSQHHISNFENEHQSGSDSYTDMPRSQEPPLTPRSMGSYSSRNDQRQASTRDGITENQWEVDLCSTGDDPELCDFLINSSWGAQQPQPLSNMAHNPFDDMFNPDTGLTSTLTTPNKLRLLTRI